MTDPSNALVPEGYKFTFEAQRTACRIMAASGSKVESALGSGVSLSTVERRISSDPMFREAFREAKAVFIRTLEKAAIERATDGVISRVPGPGGVFYDKVIHSDALLIHMLKKMDPEVHGDKQIIQIDDNTQSMNIEQLTPEARQKIKQILLDQMKRVELASDTPELLDSPHEEPPAEPEADVS